MQTDYLFPIVVPLQTDNLAGRWALIFHFLTIVIAMVFLPLLLSAAVITVTLISLRSVWDAQAVVRRSTGLVAAAPGNWHLVQAEGKRDYVEIRSIAVFGSYFVFSLRRYGSYSHIICRQSSIPREQMHKLRLLSMNPLPA